jgi:hypothetical protein
VIICVLADTHLRSDVQPHLGADSRRVMRGADLIIHAGDLVTAAVLDGLAEIAPTHAVLGNNDRELAGALPETLDLVLEGLRIGVIHDSGPRPGRAGRLQRRFPGAGLVIFGHSHLPMDEQADGGPRLFNPGSPTQRRRAPFRSIGRLEIRDGELVEHAIVPLA